MLSFWFSIESRGSPDVDCPFSSLSLAWLERLLAQLRLANLAVPHMLQQTTPVDSGAARCRYKLVEPVIGIARGKFTTVLANQGESRTFNGLLQRCGLCVRFEPEDAHKGWRRPAISYQTSQEVPVAAAVLFEWHQHCTEKLAPLRGWKLLKPVVCPMEIGAAPWTIRKLDQGFRHQVFHSALRCSGCFS